MHIDKKTIRNLFFVAVGCVVAYWVLHEPERVKLMWKWISNLVAPFVVGACLAFVINVPMRAFERLLNDIRNVTLRRLSALLLTLISFVLIVYAVVLLLIPQITETVQMLIPKLTAFFLNLEEWFWNFLAENPELMEWINANTDIEQIRNLDWPGLIQQALSLVGNSLSTLLTGAFSAVGTVAGALVDAVISLVFAIYCLMSKETLARQGRKLLYALLPEHTTDEIIRILRMTNSAFSNFISGQCLEAVILGCLFAVAMTLFGMPYVPLISVLISITALVPLVGAFVGCFLGAFFILVNDFMLAIWFVVMFLVIQQIEGNLIYPRVVGTSIGLPGMWVLVAVTVGGDLMGVGGMLLMIPVSSVLYTLLREFTAKRLGSRDIDPQKLQAQPPELRSGFREKRAKKKQAKLMKKMKSIAQKTADKGTQKNKE